MSDEATDDAVLLARARAGERAALDVLVGRHDAALFALAQRLLGSREEALDVRQDAWWRVWRGLERFDGRCAFRSFAWTVVVRLCRDRRRARGRRERWLPAAHDGADALAAVAGTAHGPDEELLAREQAAQVRDALAGLPDDERECLVLRHYHDLAVAEIAAIVGRPRTTVQSCLARALLRLEWSLRRMRGDAGGADGRAHDGGIGR